MAEWIEIKANDGGTFKAYVEKPRTSTGPVVICIQEIFGVNHAMRDITKHAGLRGWLFDKGIQHNRYLTEQEYGKHESDMLADKLGIDKQPQQKAKGGSVKGWGIARGARKAKIY